MDIVKNSTKHINRDSTEGFLKRIDTTKIYTNDQLQKRFGLCARVPRREGWLVLGTGGGYRSDPARPHGNRPVHGANPAALPPEGPAERGAEEWQVQAS